MTQDQAPRQNRNGDPCPPWCVADHDRRGNSHQTPTVAVEVDGLTSLPDKLPVFGTKADPADTRDRDYVTVAALRYGRDADDPQLHLSGREPPIEQQRVTVGQLAQRLGSDQRPPPH